MIEKIVIFMISVTIRKLIVKAWFIKPLIISYY